MGMSASQGRLLTLTARLHDIEYQAQGIMSQKIALATQKDALYQDYCDALDATTIKVAFRNDSGGKNFINANFSTLCTYNNERFQNYALRDNNSGKIIVSQDVYDVYQDYWNDKYAFAYAMMGFEEAFSTESSDQGREIGVSDYANDIDDESSGMLYMTDAERVVFDAHQDDTSLVAKYDAVKNAEGDVAKKEALDEFRDYLYKKYDSEIYDEMAYNKSEYEDVDLSDQTWDDIRDEFNFYVNLWNVITQEGGCQVVESQYASGESGNLWFNNMVESGVVSIMSLDGSGADRTWTETSVATSINNNYLQSMPDDKDLKKAEAKYEHDLEIINRKDAEFDTDLKDLETERTALTTTMESIQKVRDENIERTFGIFS